MTENEAWRGAKPLSVSSVPPRVGAKGVEKEGAPVNTYDGFHINNGATYCIVIR
jgi:hypothetical protein